MASAFGFSAGDFVTAIQLIVKISKALRETGGASTECSSVIQDLQILRQILDFLQHIRPAGGDLSRVNAIRNLAITCLIPLKEFSERIERSYGSLSGSRQSRQFWSHNSKKVQWSLLATEEISKFRALIAAKILSLGLLLGAFNIESLSRIEVQNTDNRNYLLAKVAECQDTLRKDLSEFETRHQSALSNVVDGNRREIKDNLSHLRQTTEAQYELLLQKEGLHTRHLEHLGSRIDALQIDMCANMRDIVGLCWGPRAATKHMFQTVRSTSGRLGNTLDSIQREQKRTNSQMHSSHTSFLSQLRFACAIGASLLRNLMPFSEKVLRYLQENMKTNLEIYALLLRIHQDLPKQLGASDTIHFEDALGRTENLPYVYFQHWEVFASMLYCHFKGLPGEEKVLHGDYYLINAGLNDVVFAKPDWHKTAFPGAKLKMSMVMQYLHAEYGTCPRSECQGKIGTNQNSKTSMITHCLLCGLSFAPIIWAYSSEHQQEERDRNSSLYFYEMPTAPGNGNEEAHSTFQRRTPKERTPKERARILEQLNLKLRKDAERERQEMMSFRMIRIAHPICQATQDEARRRRSLRRETGEPIKNPHFPGVPIYLSARHYSDQVN